MRTDSKRGKKTKDDVMTSTECSQSRSTFTNSVQEPLTFKMGRHFIRMGSFKVKSAPSSPTVIRRTQVLGKHTRARSVHVGWAQVVEELTWKFSKVSCVTT